MMIEHLTWLLMVLALIGVYYNIKKNPACFYYWGVSNLGWIYVDWVSGIKPQAIMMAVFLLTCIWGWREWKKEEEDE